MKTYSEMNIRSPICMPLSSNLSFLIVWFDGGGAGLRITMGGLEVLIVLSWGVSLSGAQGTMKRAEG